MPRTPSRNRTVLNALLALLPILLFGMAVDLPAATASPSFQEELVLDPTGTEAEFGQIAQVIVASDGTVYVADTGFGRIHVFDDQGQHLRSFGTVGDGPGDLPRRFPRMALDTQDHLVLTGSRTTIGWLDGEGDLVRAAERESSHPPHTFDALPDGRLLLTWPMIEWGADVVDPVMVHLLGTDGERIRSFGRSTWWKPEYRPQWVSALVAGTAEPMPDGQRIVFVQSSPFELRLYDLDGELLHRTTEGGGDFVPEPRLPEVRGDTTTFRTWGGSGPPLIAPDGTIFVRASRIHPEDDDPRLRADPDFRPRWQNRMYVYSPELELLTEMGGDDVPRPLAFDLRGRLWCRGEGDIPTLVRCRVVWE